MWFADDGHVAAAPGEWVALSAYGAALEGRFRAVGLRVAIGCNKTTLLAADGHEAGPPPGDATRWLRERAAKVQVLRCLGVPLAGAAGVTEARTAVERVYITAAETASSLARLQHPQLVATATRMAGAWSRVAYLTGLMPEGGYGVDVSALLPGCEAADLAAMRFAMGQHSEELRERQWVAVGMPLRIGGLGIQRCTAENEGFPAHIAEVVAAANRGGAHAVDVVRARHKTERDRWYAALGHGLCATASPDERARLVAQRAGNGLAMSWLASCTTLRRPLRACPAVASTALALAAGCLPHRAGGR